ncbi:MAG: fumarylacetoacetate hydrolase family protein, partial [Acidimicrobiales bacterium]
MRLVTFVEGDAAGPSGAAWCTGVVAGETVVDLTDPAVGLPGDMVELLARGEESLAAAAAAPASGARRLPLGDTHLLAPVPRPPKVLGLGMNYAAHVAEMGRTPPEHQVWFNKQRTCVVGPGAGIEVPAVSDHV